MIPSAAVEQFKVVCEEITKDPVGILIVNSKWGSINFENAKEELETIFGIVHSLKNVPLEVLPQGEFNPLNEALTQVSGQIKNIRNFSIEQGNATQARNQIVDGLKNVGSNLYTQAQMRLPFLALQRGDVKKNEEAFAKAVREAESLMQHATNDVKAKGVEIESIIAAARDAAATVGVAHFTTDFNGTADTLESAARKWLWCTGGLAVATVAGALALTGPAKFGPAVM